MKKYNAINEFYFSYVTYSTINTSTQTPTVTVTDIDRYTNSKIDNNINNDSISSKEIARRDINMLDYKNYKNNLYLYLIS